MAPNKTPDLRTTLAGVRVRNPIGVGAIGPSAMPGITHASPERFADLLLRQTEAGAGYLCVPVRYVSPDLLGELENRVKKKARYGNEYGSTNPMFMRGVKGGDRDNFYMFNPAFIAPPRSLVGLFERQGSKVLSILRKNKPKDVPILGNLGGLGAFAETFAGSAKVAQDAGVDLVEINISCALESAVSRSVEDYTEKDFPVRLGGCLVGDQPELVEAIVAAAVKAVDIPVGVKVSPETGFPRIVEVAKRAKKAGAKFINCSNNAVAILPPDIYRRGKPKWPFLDANPFIAAHGNFMRPIVYKQVAAIAKFVPGIDIIATGGLMTPEHLIEAMMLGAKSSHFVTAYLFNGSRFITISVNFLTHFLEQEGYGSVDEIIGLGLEYIKPLEEIKVGNRRTVATLDLSKCSHCGLCTANHSCLALKSQDGVLELNIDECTGCGMCVAICNKEAMSLRQLSLEGA